MRQRERRERRGPNTVILDPVTGWGCAYRENPPGEPLRYQGRLMHLCYVEGEQLRAVELPTKLAGQLPEDLYQARNWPEVKPIFGVVRSALEKLQANLWIAAIGILALLVFLMFGELTG
jgi:hypothetical protein